MRAVPKCRPHPSLRITKLEIRCKILTHPDLNKCIYLVQYALRFSVEGFLLSSGPAAQR
jgi:hypothetical protein